MADELLTLLAGVGEQAVVAGDAVRTVLHLDVFASTQGLLALLAAQLVAHDDGEKRRWRKRRRELRTSWGKRQRQTRGDARSHSSSDRLDGIWEQEGPGQNLDDVGSAPTEQTWKIHVRTKNRTLRDTLSAGHQI